MTMTTDTSKIGWGFLLQDTPTGGQWTPEEAQKYIDYLEIKSVLLGLKSYKMDITNKHIKVLVENTTAVSCINHMGACHFKDVNKPVITIWEWCINHNMWLTVVHISGTKNTLVYKEYNAKRSETEWALSPQLFQGCNKKA